MGKLVCCTKNHSFNWNSFPGVNDNSRATLFLPNGKAEESLDPGPLRDAPESFRVLEPGRIAEGLEAP